MAPCSSLQLPAVIVPRCTALTQLCIHLIYLIPLLILLPYTLLGDGLGEALGETLGLGVFLRGGGAACDASEPWGDMSASFLIMGSVYSWISLRM